MPDFAAPIARLIDELKHLPGIGQKTAQRLAFHLLRAKPEDALALADAIREAKLNMRECSVCNNITDTDPCLFCSSATRNRQDYLRRGRAGKYSGDRKDAAIWRALSRAGRLARAAAGRRTGPTENQEPDRAIEGRRRGRNHYRHESQRPKAKRRPMYLSKLIKPLGSLRDADRRGHPGRLGPGICGRSDDDEGHGRPAGAVEAARRIRLTLT